MGVYSFGKKKNVRCSHQGYTGGHQKPSLIFSLTVVRGGHQAKPHTVDVGSGVIASFVPKGGVLEINCAVHDESPWPSGAMCPALCGLDPGMLVWLLTR